MTIATLDEVATWDDEGQIEGFQFGGRERALQEWKEKKEAEEFAALCERLYHRKWAAKKRQTEEGRQKLQEALRRYRAENREHCNALERQRRKAKYEADPVVNQCEECGEIWIVPYERKGPKSSRFCSVKCKNRWHGIRRARRRNRGLRKMDIKPQLLRYLRRHPGSTAQEIATGIGAKVNSVRSLLSVWSQSPEFRREGRKPIRYFFEEAQQ